GAGAAPTVAPCRRVVRVSGGGTPVSHTTTAVQAARPWGRVSRRRRASCESAVAGRRLLTRPPRMERRARGSCESAAAGRRLLTRAAPPAQALPTRADEPTDTSRVREPRSLPTNDVPTDTPLR